MSVKKLSLFILYILLPVLIFGNELIHGPYMQDARPHQITIKWETKKAEIGKVIYGSDSLKLNLSIKENHGKKLHEITLKNLSSNTLYYYKCRWSGGESATGRFRTAPIKDSTPMRLAFTGDSRSDLAMCKKISDLIIKRNPNIVVHTGDIVASGKHLKQWETFLFHPMEKLLRNIPIYPVLGNHEQESPYYYDYFSIHNGKPWWSVNYGSVHLVGLDTNLPCDEGSEQYKFLLKDLKKNKKEWIIVVFHHPLFNSHPTRESSPLRFTLQPLFLKYGVDLVITGHDHYYLRTFPIGHMSENQDGVIHITTAGGGASLYPTIPKSYAAYHRSLYHFLLIDVTAQDLTVRAINDRDQCFDAIVINKQNEYPPAEFIEYEMVELEKKINLTLGKILPKSDAKGEIYFDTTFTVKTDFYLPVKGFYQWQSPEKWIISSNGKSLKIDKGGALTVKFKAKVNKNYFMPTPILKLHLEADNSSRNVIDHRPYQPYLGFRNQDLTFPLEKAAYKAAVLAPPGDIRPLLSFLDYYGSSRYAQAAVIALGSQIMQTHDKRIYAGLKRIIKKNPSDLNKYRIYPFYFLYNDFSHLEEWISVMDKVSAEQRTFSPRIICLLTDLENFHTRLVKNWYIAGPFITKNKNAAKIVLPPEKNQALSSVYKSANGTIVWKSYKQEGKIIDFLDYFKTYDLTDAAGAVFSVTEINAKKDGQILLLLGSNDDPTVWVNGKEVFKKYVGRSVRPCSDVIPVSVKKGKNKIMLKIAQRGGAWGLTLKISDWQNILQ